MKTVELIYDEDCPNVSEARANLLRAFAAAGVPARWSEWARADAACPPYVSGYGSPTILVDGRDVAGGEFSEGVSCCRLYAEGSGGYKRAPSVQMIAKALRAAAHSGPEGR